MRNAQTDKLAVSLQKAYKRSGLSIVKFVKHLTVTRKIEIDTTTLGYSFFVVVLGEYVQFYYDKATDCWFCKI